MIPQVLTYFCEWPRESPETSESHGLQVVRLLLGSVFKRNHVLNNALHRVQNELVMAEGQDVRNLSIQQRMSVQGAERGTL